MVAIRITAATHIQGVIQFPADKSMCHRAVLLGSIADGLTQISGDFDGNDVRASIDAMRSLGVKVDHNLPRQLIIHGVGLRGLKKAAAEIDCVKSGTTMRLLAGLLAGQNFSSTLIGHAQLLRRPMDRVIEPLNRLGASATTGPLHLPGKKLGATDLVLAIPSAQVKSAALLAALYAEGITTVKERGPCRNHTELMLKQFGTEITVDNKLIIINPTATLSGGDLKIPGDISSAAFFVALGVLHVRSSLVLKSIGVNVTRTGFLDALEKMGANIDYEDRRNFGLEPLADLTINTGELRGAIFGGDDIVKMIDELPILAVVATQASGITIIRNAEELKVKESDRIHAIVAELRKLGANIEELPDGFIVEGGHQLRGTRLNSHGDHRIAMALTIAGTIALGTTQIDDCESIADSFPQFVQKVRECGVQIEHVGA